MSGKILFAIDRGRRELEVGALLERFNFMCGSEAISSHWTDSHFAWTSIGHFAILMLPTVYGLNEIRGTTFPFFLLAPQGSVCTAPCRTKGPS